MSQTVAPSCAAIVPSLHVMHFDAPVRFCAVPGAHRMHFVCPGFSWKLPGAHGVHSVAFSFSEYLPGAHSVHVLASLPLQVPSGQPAQPSAVHEPGLHPAHSGRLALPYVPAGHATHSSPCVLTHSTVATTQTRMRAFLIVLRDNPSTMRNDFSKPKKNGSFDKHVFFPSCCDSGQPFSSTELKI